MVVNSHTHFEHIGDNFRFPEVWVYADRQAKKALSKGVYHDELWYSVQPEMFKRKVPQGFDPNGYMIRPVGVSKIKFLFDGYKIDLGRRILEVIHTPGHTFDSIILCDKKNRLLFTGDTFYPDDLFARFKGGVWGWLNPEIYEASINKIATFIADLDYLYCSHVLPLVDPAMLISLKGAFSKIRKNEVHSEVVIIDNEILKKFKFNCFSIVAPKV